MDNGYLGHFELIKIVRKTVELKKIVDRGK